MRDRKYGLSTGDYERMLAEQGGRCAVCRALPATVLNVDHCHETGLVRGLLCGTCNRALGQASDNPQLLRKLADYVERSIR